MAEKNTTTALRNIRRITFQILRANRIQREFELRLMPESYLLDEPGRVNVVQTRGQGWVDNFGIGFGTLSITGTTGFKIAPNPNLSTRKAKEVDGYERWVDLREFFRVFFRTQTDFPGDPVVMNVLNWTQEDYLKCVPQGLPRLQRNVAQPLLYRYELNFWVLGRLEKEGYDPRKEDILRKISQQTVRAGAIGTQIGNKLESTWQTFVTEIQNSTNLPLLTDAQKDANQQAFVDRILAKYTAPTYLKPTDSPDGIVKRTRTLSEKISDYADGNTWFIESTLTEARVIVQEWRNVLDAIDFAVSIPASYGREVKELLCACQAILTYPQLFRQTVVGTFTELTGLLEDSGCASTLRA